ncbi:MAG: RNA methyltransferase [Chloroflexi bacterium]|nr:MAG: RNA methyltransferase [Chloroflexota bacterium]
MTSGGAPFRNNEIITSTANARVKLIRGLRARREREHSGLAWVEGIRPTVEALQLNAVIDTLVVAPDLLTSDFARDAVDVARVEGIDIMEVTNAVFRSLSDRDGPQGLGAIIRQQWLSLPDIRLAEGDRWVALASVADPGNLGTILRTCDGSDAEGVILLDTSTDPYDPAAMRASMGAVFSRRLVRASFEAFAQWTRAEGATVVGASDRAPETYREADYGARTVLLMGSEREGLTTEQQTLCDRMVSIPMRGRSDSLNLGIATAILLYEVLDRREHEA